MSDEENRRLVERVSKRLIHMLDGELAFLKSHGIGVTLFAFTFDPGAIAYISTADREDMIRSVKEWIACQEAGLTTDPAGERAKS